MPVPVMARDLVDLERFRLFLAEYFGVILDISELDLGSVTWPKMLAMAALGGQKRASGSATARGNSTAPAAAGRLLHDDRRLCHARKAPNRIRQDRR